MLLGPCTGAFGWLSMAPMMCSVELQHSCGDGHLKTQKMGLCEARSGCMALPAPLDVYWLLVGALVGLNWLEMACTGALSRFLKFSSLFQQHSTMVLWKSISPQRLVQNGWNLDDSGHWCWSTSYRDRSLLTQWEDLELFVVCCPLVTSRVSHWTSLLRCSCVWLLRVLRVFWLL